MPEGDTVFRTARALHRAFAGRRLTASDLRVPQLATTDLTGWTVTESVSRGKHLLLRLLAPSAGVGAGPSGSAGVGAGPSGSVGIDADPPELAMTLHSHLGMDGSWRVYAVGERWRAQRRDLVRAVLRTADAIAVGYQLQQIALVPTGDEKDLLAQLGPDLLDPAWDPAEAVRRLARRPTIEIGEALRDQRNLAGIGNVYCSELLFLRGIWPRTPVGQVADLSGVVALAHRLLDANRNRATRTTTGSLRRGETTYVYGRPGEPCRRCTTRIEAAEQADRTTYWCPSCQPAPPEARPSP